MMHNIAAITTAYLYLTIAVVLLPACFAEGQRKRNAAQGKAATGKGMKTPRAASMRADELSPGGAEATSAQPGASVASVPVVAVNLSSVTTSAGSSGVAYQQHGQHAAAFAQHHNNLSRGKGRGRGRAPGLHMVSAPGDMLHSGHKHVLRGRGGRHIVRGRGVTVVGPVTTIPAVAPAVAASDPQ